MLARSLALGVLLSLAACKTTPEPKPDAESPAPVASAAPANRKTFGSPVAGGAALALSDVLKAP